MAHANERRALVLNTGNKSEALMGYCTLYGDSIGAVAPLGNVLKTEVYALAEYINNHYYPTLKKNLIPKRIIDRPPTAELRKGQKDSDDLPPYDVLDPILDRIAATRFKRDQSPPALGIEE
jgi:NAD+ synthetase